MATYAYFPGCSLEGTSREYGASTVEVCRALGIELQELDDWSCCGATSAHSISGDVADALAGRNLALAGELGHDLVVPCAACYNRTKRAASVMQDADEGRPRLERLIGRPLGEPVSVLHLLEALLTDEAVARLESQANAQPAVGKVACYYGCLLLRPVEVTGFDDAEAPRTMERLLRKCGLDACEWHFANECCGASLAIPQSASVARLVARIVSNARAAGAQSIVTACPLCQVNLSTRQRLDAGQEPMPALYITQVLGLAMGMAPRALGLRREPALGAAVGGPA